MHINASTNTCMRAHTHSHPLCFPVGNVWHWKIILMAKVQRLNSITGTAGYWTAEYYYVTGRLGCSLLPLNTHTHTLFYWRNYKNLDDVTFTVVRTKQTCFRTSKEQGLWVRVSLQQWNYSPSCCSVTHLTSALTSPEFAASVICINCSECSTGPLFH